MSFSLLESELRDSREIAFSRIGNLPEITHYNVVLAEAMIANDSDYIQSGDVFAGPKGKYQGSTAYWMKQLRRDLDEGSSSLKDTLLKTVCAVDRENSTHLSADSIGPHVLTERIYSKRKRLISILKDREEGFSFIEYLSEKTAKETMVKNGKTYFPRENYSFATKFCHYACMFFFDNNAEREYRDNYSIYDNVVAKALPDYLRTYRIFKADNKEYKETDFDHASKYKLFSELIDRLRNKKVSRNGFDHLLWYYHKAR